MPYIPEPDRDTIKPTTIYPARTAGELNYQVTVLIDTFMRVNGKNYQAMNDVVGALDGAKAEFQRRVVAPYEDQKIIQNGDVYWGYNVEDYNG